MINHLFPDVLTITASLIVCCSCLFLSGCQSSGQAQAELEQENIALERQIQENYAFMQHQQRRINALESQTTAGTAAQPVQSQPSTPRPVTPRPTSSTSNLRQSWVNPNTGQPAETAQPAALQPASPLDQIDADPNAVPDVSVPNTPTQKVPTNLFNGTDNQGSQTGLPPALPQVSQLPLVNVSEVEKIAIVTDQTGPLQIDFDRQEFGLRLLLQCISKQGESVTTVCNITVVALDPSLQGEQARVAQWDITPQQVQRQITQSPQPDGILFELGWPKGKPTGSIIDLFVRLEDGTGSRLQARQTIQMNGQMFAVVSPSAQPTEQALPIVDDNEQNYVAPVNYQVPLDPVPDTVATQNSSLQGELEQGEVSKSEVVVAEPQVEALKARSRVEVSPMLVSPPSSVVNNPVNTATQPGQNTPQTEPETQTTLRPNWSPYR